MKTLNVLKVSVLTFALFIAQSFLAQEKTIMVGGA